MENRAAAELYHESAILTAPPVKLVRLTTEGAVRFIDRAKASAEEGDRRACAHWLERAGAIVCELHVALVPAGGSDVAMNLERLYAFCEGRIADARRTGSIEPALEARRVLAILLDAWQGIEVERA